MDELKKLMAEREIRKQLYRYCRSMDRMDSPLGYTVFAENSRVDYGMHFQGSGREFVDWAENSHRRTYAATTHQMTNMLIEVSDDLQRAASETYLHTLQLTKPYQGVYRELHIAGRYIDRWIVEDGNWRIVHRRYVQDIAELRVCQEATERFGGTRDSSDPSYEAFAWVNDR